MLQRAFGKARILNPIRALSNRGEAAARQVAVNSPGTGPGPPG